ncbi:MAG: hypothetical protein LBG22_09425 [Treponema sp.]|nr:hypothetical protein [Treponema sp.]
MRNVFRGVAGLSLAIFLFFGLAACPSPLSGFSLTGRIIAPVRDTQPVATAIDTVPHIRTLVWQTADGAAHTGAFAASMVCRAVASPAAKPGYTFNGVAVAGRG